MDINEILNSLGIDLTNPEARRGAIEAIQAILDSRTPPLDMSNVGGATTSGEVDVELDPDLIQPSQKFNPPSSDNDTDIEIEDEEDILSQIKHNESEDELSNDGNTSGDDSDDSDSEDSSFDDEDSSDSEGSSSGGADGEGDTSKSDDNEDVDDAESASEIADEDDNETEASNSSSEDTDETTDNTNEDEDEAEAVEPESEDDGLSSEDKDSDEDEEAEDNENDEDEFDEDDFDENEDEATEDEESEEEFEPEIDTEFDDEEEPEEDEFDFDEDDFLDDELKNSYDDQEAHSKREARRIKRERTLAAAKTALEKAKARNISQSLINELEKSIEALESLTEAKAKSLADISDEEFNLMVNRVFDAISAVGDNNLTFTSDEEREMRAQEIKTDLESRETRQELSDEDIAAIRAETQAVKAREKETAVYRKPAASSFKGFQEFLNSLYRAIALQVQTNEVQDDTWSAINRRYSGTGILKQGQRKNDLPDKKIPVIDFYFDCSGSWGPADIEVGKRAVSTLVDMEEKGQIKINIYYFSNHVFNDMQSALNEGGTRAWNDIVKNVIATQATNVIVMTDSDMEDVWEGQYRGDKALKYTVPGYVWYLWRNGENAPRLPRDLKGRGGVQQFSFNHGDV